MVNPADTNTAMLSSELPALSGDAVTFTGEVRTSGVATGTVTFVDNKTATWRAGSTLVTVSSETAGDLVQGQIVTGIDFVSQADGTIIPLTTIETVDYATDTITLNDAPLASMPAPLRSGPASPMTPGRLPCRA